MSTCVFLLTYPYCSWMYLSSWEATHLSFKIFCVITIHGPLNTYFLWEIRAKAGSKPHGLLQILPIQRPFMTSPSSIFKGSPSNFSLSVTLPSSSPSCLLSGSDHSCILLSGYPWDYIMYIMIIHDHIFISMSLSWLHLKSPFSSIRSFIGFSN